MSLGPLVILERDIYAEIPAIIIRKIDAKMKYLFSYVRRQKARLVKMATLRTGNGCRLCIQLFSEHRATMIFRLSR
jgi:hypothetical protein